MISNSTILEDIQATLSRLERDHDVRILYACESGSRAWGFASPDSDYDVRFIYVHTKDWYLGIDERKDVIDLPVNEVLDVNGWELRKTLRLFRSSNAALYEWLQSPIVYRSENGFYDAIQPLMPAYFSLRAGAHHYLSMAHNTFSNELQQEDVRLKKYFYALRPLLAVKWIVERSELPPMEFGKLRTLITDNMLQAVIDEVLAQKAASGEKAMIKQLPLLQQFIADELAICEEATRSLERKDSDTETLNELFRRML